MGIKEIIARIKEEGAQEIEKINDQYEKRILEIKKNQERESKLFFDAELENIQKEAEDVKRGLILSAKLEKRKKVLQAKRDLMKQVLKEAQKNLKTLLGAEKYSGFLKKGLSLAQEGDTVFLSAADLKEFGDELKKSGAKNLNFKEAAIQGGMIIEKGSFNYNFSVEALAEKKAEELEKNIGMKLHVL